MWEVFPYKCVLEVFYVDVFNENIFLSIGKFVRLYSLVAWRASKLYFLKLYSKRVELHNNLIKYYLAWAAKSAVKDLFFISETYVSFWFGLWKYHSNIFFVHTWFYDVCSQFSNLDEFDSHYCITGLKEVLLN